MIDKGLAATGITTGVGVGVQTSQILTATALQNIVICGWTLGAIFTVVLWLSVLTALIATVLSIIKKFLIPMVKWLYTEYKEHKQHKKG